ncbi:breast cancer 2 susceptibility protein [Pseudohyphozyma bogoriensis]|nr:breast cancer 2 susceptibility protein [Pseudohyphozyma bogoriensis]
MDDLAGLPDPLDVQQQPSQLEPDLAVDAPDDAHRDKRPRLEDELDVPQAPSPVLPPSIPLSTTPQATPPLSSTPAASPERRDDAVAPGQTTEQPHLSQGLADFFDNLASDDLDFLPSPDPIQHQSSQDAHFRRVGPSPSPWNGDSIFGLARVPEASIAEDEGTIMEGELLDDGVDPELAVGDEVMLEMSEEELLMPAECGGGALATQEVDLWAGFEEDDTRDGGGVSATAKAKGKGRAEEQDDEDDYDPHALDLLPDPWAGQDALTAGVFFRAGGARGGTRFILSESALAESRAVVEGTKEDAPASSSRPAFARPSLAPPSSFNLHQPTSSPVPRPSPSITHTPRQPHPHSNLNLSITTPKDADVDNDSEPSSPPPPSHHVGFTFGNGKLATLSSAALAKAKALILGDSPPPSIRAPAAFGGFGFASASGAAIAPPSDDANSRATALLQQEDEPSSSTPRVPSSPPQSMPSFGGFMSGAGVRLKVSDEAKATAEELLRDRDVFEASPVAPSRKGMGLSMPPPRTSAAKNVGGLTVDSPTSARVRGSASTDNRSPLAQVNSARTASAPTSPTRRASPLPAPQSPPKTSPPIVANQDSVIRTAAPSSIRTTVSRPRPTPSRPTASTSASLATPSRLPAFKSPMISRQGASTPGGGTFGTPLKPAPALRRLNVSMTPRSRATPTHKFSTPFKNGVRPAGLTPTGLTPSGKGKVEVRSKGASEKEEVSGGPKEKKLNKVVPVFDLEPKGPREDLLEAAFRPQTRYFEDLLDDGVPEEALAMDFASAVSFHFECGRGEKEALSALEEAGASLVTAAWVKNHWTLIVWKLASLVRSRPDVLETYWSWEAAVNQLKYRYEREVNNAQRSCIKRVQERDSSAALSMTLCVTKIRWDDIGDSEATSNAQLAIVGLELTDGWYRIRTNVDQTLKSACERGKIVVGSKLTIRGARLIISANSTILAPWYAKLGFVQQPFVASLESLTSGGGVAPLVRVVIERVFPRGYMDIKRPKEGTWNAEEERERADRWTTGRAKIEARLAEQQEAAPGEWDHVVELLQDAAYESGPALTPSAYGSSTEEEPDEILDRLEDAPNKTTLIRRLSQRQVHECLELAQRYAEQARERAIAELQEELASAYPERNVRNFCVLRVRDAIVGPKGSKRTAQLTVWDVEAFDDDYFELGKEYLWQKIE